MARAKKGSAKKVSGLSVTGGGSSGKGTSSSVAAAKGVNASVSVKTSSSVKSGSSVSKATPSSGRTTKSTVTSSSVSRATTSVSKTPSKPSSVNISSPAKKGTSVNLSKAGSFDPKTGQITTGFKKGTSVNLSKAGSLKFSPPESGGLLSQQYQVIKTPASKTVPLKDAPVFKQTLQGLMPLNEKALNKALIEGRPIVLPASLLLQQNPFNQSYVVDSPVREKYYSFQQDPITDFFSPPEAFAEQPTSGGGLSLVNTGADPTVQQPSGSTQSAPEGGFVGGAVGDTLSEIGEKAGGFFDSLKKDPIKLAIVVIGAIALILIFGKGGKR